MLIANLMQHGILILIAQTTCPDSRLKLRKSIEVDILIRVQWKEDDWPFSDQRAVDEFAKQFSSTLPCVPEPFLGLIAQHMNNWTWERIMFGWKQTE